MIDTTTRRATRAATRALKAAATINARAVQAALAAHLGAVRDETRANPRRRAIAAHKAAQALKIAVRDYRAAANAAQAIATIDRAAQRLAR